MWTLVEDHKRWWKDIVWCRKSGVDAIFGDYPLLTSSGVGNVTFPQDEPAQVLHRFANSLEAMEFVREKCPAMNFTRTLARTL